MMGRQFPGFAMVNQLCSVVICALVGLLALPGCAAPRPDYSPPDWLRHHTMPQTVESAQLDTQIAAITQDLSAPLPLSGARPPEEIAISAIHALEHGLIPDACLLIAAADYRFFQAAKQAAANQKITRQDARYLALSPLPRQVAERLMAREVEVYSTRRFTDQLDMCTDLLFNRRGQENLVSRIATRILTTERDAMEDILTNLRASDDKTSTSAPNLSLAHPELAAALLTRLKQDARSTESDRRAWELLAALPFADFQIAALEQVQTYAEPLLLRTLLRHSLKLPGLIDRVRSLMESPSATTRSNVAILGGFASGLRDIQEISRLAEKETDPLTRLSLIFALAAKGDHDAFLSLLQAAAGDAVSGDEQDHAMSLLHWLPETTKKSLTPEDLFRLLDSSRGRYIAFAGALALVQQMAPSIGADGPTVAFIMKRLGMIDETILVERLARALAAIPQIDHTSVLAAVELSQHANQRIALLMRLEQLVGPEDLPYLVLWWSRFPDTDTRLRIVDATTRITGEAATAALLEFFDDPQASELTRYRIAINLALRPDAPCAHLSERVLRYPSDYTLPVLLLCGDERGPKIMQAAFESSDPVKRFVAVSTASELDLDSVDRQLWVQTTYIERHRYPNDVILRHAALQALLGRAMTQAAESSK
jgi:hypothetical protein